MDKKLKIPLPEKNMGKTKNVNKPLRLLFRISSMSEILLADDYFKFFKLSNKELNIREDKILRKLIQFEICLGCAKYHCLGTYLIHHIFVKQCYQISTTAIKSHILRFL